MKFLLFAISLLFITPAFSNNKADVDTVKELAFVKELLAQDTALGKVTINADPRINELTWKHMKMAEYEGGVEGWRIQIYNSSGREAREEADEVRTKFLNKYPDVKAYLIYQPPYFKIRIGDYRTKQEAYLLYKQVVRHFPVSYLVPDRINFPELHPEEASNKRRGK